MVFSQNGFPRHNTEVSLVIHNYLCARWAASTVSSNKLPEIIVDIDFIICFIGAHAEPTKGFLNCLCNDGRPVK